MEVLQGVHIGDDAREKIAAAESAELRRRQRLDPLVDPDASPPSARKARSWDASRSKYRAIGRASPKKRTPTIATVSDSTDGCSAAREIR